MHAEPGDAFGESLFDVSVESLRSLNAAHIVAADDLMAALATLQHIADAETNVFSSRWHTKVFVATQRARASVHTFLVYALMRSPHP